MFESLQEKKILFSADHSGTGGSSLTKRQDVDQTFEDLTSNIRELERLNIELREARRAAFNLLEDAVQSKEALQKSEEKYRTKLEQEVLDRTAELKRSQQQYVSLVENTPDAITRWNKYLKLVYANTAFADKIEASLKDLYGKTNLEMGQPDHIAVPYMNSLRKVFETGHATEHYDSFPTPNGEVFFYSRIVPEKNEKGEIETVLAISRDVTELKKAEQEMRESENRVGQLNKSLFALNKELNSLNSELKTFTGVAANDYGETLRHLYINLEMIVTNDARNLSNSGRANLRRAQGAIQKMKLVTEDLISFSKLREIGGREDNVNLNNFLRAAIDDFTNKPGQPPIQINCDHLPSINGYSQLLYLLFRNLLDNAIKFRKQDNDHVINITCRELVNGNKINIDGAEKNTNYTVISVSDNGIGFPQTESEKIFEMFYRLHEKVKYKGSGMGLTICKRIMEMHGGFIAAEGVPDQGATFHCYFPALKRISDE
jgi:PAS domain S-box-containing protein